MAAGCPAAQNSSSNSVGRLSLYTAAALRVDSKTFRPTSTRTHVAEGRKSPNNGFRIADAINTCIVQGVLCSEMRLGTSKTAIMTEHKALPIVVSRTEIGTCFSCKLCQYNLSVPVAISHTERSDAWAASCSGLRIEGSIG